eukprot:m.14359 g.14359  ORF g.14359 m.14359 type:complete len:837 (+) comp25705_c0_seq4:231-2741(+)
MVKTVFPDKLPCNSTSSFVVALDDALPEGVEDFTLTFKGRRSKKRSQGSACRLDSRTLLATTGIHDESEEVSVSMTAIGKAFRVEQFKMNFLHAYQMICGLLPDNATVHAAAALAQCLPDDFIDATTLDEQLDDLCDRLSTPADLTAAGYYGGSCRWTLLHLAARRNLPKFAAQLLVRSAGASVALQITDDEGLTPCDIALKLWKGEEIVQVFQDYERETKPTKDDYSQKRMKTRKSALDIALEKHQEEMKNPELKKKDKNKPAKLFKRLTFSKVKSNKKGKDDDSDKEKPEGSAYASNSELETRLQARRPLPKTPPEPPHPPDSKDEQSNNHEEDDNVVGIGSGYVNSTFTATVADPPDAISVKSGADVNVLSEEGDWIVIFYNGKKGRVPRSYLCIEIFNDESIYEKIDDLSKQDSDTKIDGLELSDYYNAPEILNNAGKSDVYVALYDFVAQRDDQLTIYVGDQLRVLEMSDTGWWKAQLLGKEKSGLVPSNYIQKEDPKDDPPSGSRSSSSSQGSKASKGSHSSRNSGEHHLESSHSSGGSVSNAKSAFNTLPKSLKLGGMAKSASVDISGGRSGGGGGGIASILANSPAFSRAATNEEDSPVPAPVYSGGGIKLKSATIKGRSGTAPPDHQKVMQSGGTLESIKAKLESKSSSAPTTPVPKRKIVTEPSKEPMLPQAGKGISAVLKARRFEEAAAATSGSSSAPIIRKAVGDSSAGKSKARQPQSLTDSPIFKKRLAQSGSNEGSSGGGKAQSPSEPPRFRLPPKPPKLQQVQQSKWRVLYDYKDADSHFFVKEGDILQDVDMASSTEEWLLAKVGLEQGYVPRNYVTEEK